MPFDLNALIRPNIRSLSPYSSARDEYSGSSGIFMDANENSLGSPGDRFYNRYPDPGQKQMKQAMADYRNCDPGQIFFGNGSDEAIDLIIRIFCVPGRDNILTLPPTYGMYQVAAAVNNIQVLQAPLNSDFSLDPRRTLQAADEHTKLLFICSPNNPSANLMDSKAILTILNDFPGLVVLDEAYIDFAASRGWLPHLKKHPNLVVLQTFSKAWGLAGLRLGMAFADPQIIALMNRIKYPYNVNSLTQYIALESLARADEMKKRVKILLLEREKLHNELLKYEFVTQIFPSDANFLLVRVADADDLYEFLLQNQIIVRNRSNQLHCENCLRITIGTEDENESLLNILDGY